MRMNIRMRRSLSPKGHYSECLKKAPRRGQTISNEYQNNVADWPFDSVSVYSEGHSTVFGLQNGKEGVVSSFTVLFLFHT